MAESHHDDDHSSSSSHPPKGEKAASPADHAEHHHTGNGWVVAGLIGVLIGLGIWGLFSLVGKPPVVTVTAPPATVQVTVPPPETAPAPPAAPKPPAKKTQPAPTPTPPAPLATPAPAPPPSLEVASVKYCGTGYTQVQSVGYAVCLKWPVAEVPGGRAAVSWVSLQDTSIFAKPGSAIAPAGRVEWIPLAS